MMVAQLSCLHHARRAAILAILRPPKMIPTSDDVTMYAFPAVEHTSCAPRLDGHLIPHVCSVLMQSFVAFRALAGTQASECA